MHIVYGSVTGEITQVRIQRRQNQPVPEHCIYVLQGTRGTLESFIKSNIGNDDRAIEADDIRLANKLMYGASVLMLIISAIARFFIFGGFI